MEKEKSTFWKYFWTQNEKSLKRGTILLFVIGLVVWFTNIERIDWTNLDGWYAHFWDPILGVTTVLLGLSIWYFETQQQWKKQLPGFLSAAYYVDGKLWFYVHKLTVPPEGDMRAYAKSLVQEKSKGKMNFSPYFDYEKNEKDYDVDIGYIQHFKLKFTLLKDNEPIKDWLEKEDKEITIWHRGERNNVVEHIATWEKFKADSEKKRIHKELINSISSIYK